MKKAIRWIVSLLSARPIFSAAHQRVYQILDPQSHSLGKVCLRRQEIRLYSRPRLWRQARRNADSHVGRPALAGDPAL